MTRSITPGFAGSSNKHFTQFSPLVQVPCLCNQTARELRCSFNELIRPGKREKLKGKNISFLNLNLSATKRESSGLGSKSSLGKIVSIQCR